MAIIKCKMCGGDLELIPGQSVAECEYCGSRQTVPTADNEKKMTLFARANRLRAACEFDKAAGVYESIVADFPEEAEAYWGLVLCKYGIEYVDDPATGKKIPTCHRSSFDSILEDSDFEQALENADVVARKQYREEAKQIEEIRKGIIAVSANEQPYDIFICYKETDENGERTLDSVLAQDIYDALTAKNYRVFFSRITLEDKLGLEYEPYIFAALNSAKIMLAVGTDYEYYNAVWVKNEWSRYLKLMAKDKDKHLIPCFKGIDAYDMPKEFARLQAQDLGKVGAMQDLLRGIEKVLQKDQQVTAQGQVIASGNPTADSLLKRVFLFLEDKDWKSADEYCEKALDIDPENPQAYLGKVMVSLKCSSADQIATRLVSLDSMKDFVRAMQFAKGETLRNLQRIREDSKRMLLYKQLIVNIGRLHNKRVNEENARIKKENYYTKAKLLMQEADTEQAYREANKIFTAISGYKDCAELAGQCEQMADQLCKATEQKKLDRFHNLIEEYEELKKYEQPALRLPDLQKKYGELSAQKQTTTNFLPSFPEKSRQLSVVESEIEETKAKIVSLENEYKTLGFFSSKRKKAIENILPVYHSNIDSMTKKAAQLRHQLHGYTSTDEIEQKIRNLVLQLDKISEEIAIASEAKKKLYDVDRIFRAIHDEGLADYIFSEKRADILAQWMDYQVKNSELAEVKFGKYMDRPIEWLVLEKIDKRILVISKEALDCQPYNTSKTDVTWETCSLRNWLNDTFLNAAFALEEQAMIPAVTISADKNPNYSTDPGKETQDKIFLLSIQEVNKYFTSDNARQCKPTDYAVANRVYVDKDTGNCWWWLRSPGHDQGDAANVEYYGGVGKYGNSVYNCFGAVRPALWIDLGY